MTKVKALPQFTEKVFYVFDVDELVALTKSGVNPPSVGVTYEGNVAIRDASKLGIMALMQIGIMVFNRGSIAGTADLKTATTQLLIDLGGVILGTQAPSGHQWRFAQQRPVFGSDGMLAYQQVWEVPIALSG